MSERPWYPPPPGGWVCFHCGEKFTSYGSAKLHFGADPDCCDAACRIKAGEEFSLLEKIRKLEEDLADYRAAYVEEDSDAERQHFSAMAEHAWALQKAEEEGYAKGLKDGRGFLAWLSYIYHRPWK